MVKDLKRGGGSLLLFLNPLSALAMVIIGLVIIILLSVLGLGIIFSGSSSGGSGMYTCHPDGELQLDPWNAQFSNAGAFTNRGDDFIHFAEKNNIDPVLLASIAFHETGKGTSKMVRERNNPGGLYNSKTGTFFVYGSLEEGIDAMASNLYRLYISQGLYTIEEIGSKYAPIGVANDPNNMNVHWVPNVSKMISQFGGLILNCSLVGFESGFSSPLQVMDITSHYGVRVHPITGDVKHHAGIDFRCNIGAPIMAAMTGIVEVSTYHDGWGNYVKINHGDKSTLYAHMTETYVKAGNSVSQGMQIGTCGSTGASTGAHLHLELYVGSSHIDPLPYFSNAGVK